MIFGYAPLWMDKGARAAVARRRAQDRGGAHRAGWRHRRAYPRRCVLLGAADGRRLAARSRSRAKLSQVGSGLTVLLPHTGGQSFPSADEIADRSSMHLPHELGSVQLDGDYAYAEVERDLFVAAALCHFTQRLPLACGESFKPLYMLLDGLRRCALCQISCDPGGDRIEQALVADRLRQKIDGAALHGLNAHWNIAMTSKEHDRLHVTARDQVPLKIESTEPGQTHVQNQAAGSFVERRFEQLLCGTETSG